MWSFAWYDTIQNSLILCRDRFGEKPLFVWKQKNGIYFGSELNSLFIYAGFKAQVNRRMLARYLYEGYRSMHRDVNTFFEGINQVESGSYLSMRSLNVQESTKYWEPNWNKSQELSRTESIDLVREAMINAVKLRLRADVPIAFCMSGGIDSNSLIGIAKNCLNYEPHGFTLIGSDKRYQEEGMVDIMAKNCGIKNTKIELSSEGSFGKLKDLVSLKCQPVATISYFIHWQMMQLISQMGYKVSISGTGADEIFSGYYDHHLLYLASISQGTDFHVNSVNNWKKYVKPQVRNELLRNPYKYCVDPEARNHIYADSMMFVTEEGKKLLNGFSEVKYTDDLMRNRMLNELFHESVPVMLQEDDFNSMYYSIENRSPFLDRKLVEGVYGSVPTIRLIEDGKAKFILREAMRGIVPEQIINNRKKIGFNADINDILDFGNDRELWEYLNEDSEIYNLVDKTSVQALAVQSTKSNADSKFLFSVLCTKLFLDFGA
jgi:asparagine synthase (glutamine-hydrolysing)